MQRVQGKDSSGGDEEKEDKPEEYYHYHLAGVVVHMGTANSGHYYSYIRPRDGGGEWLEFNDTVVSTFDVEVCFRSLIDVVAKDVSCLRYCLAHPEKKKKDLSTACGASHFAGMDVRRGTTGL